MSCETFAGKAVDLGQVTGFHSPFTHFVIPDFLNEELSLSLLKWFEEGAVWKFHGIEDFYENYNINLQQQNLPSDLLFLRDESFVQYLQAEISKLFNCKLLQKVDVSAHKLQPGHRIGIHTDFGATEQSHRLLIQLNRGWRLENGGMLMFFDEEFPSSVSDTHKYYLPIHRGAIAFEITPKSFHAVSKVIEGERYTLTYSFYKQQQ